MGVKNMREKTDQHRGRRVRRRRRNRRHAGWVLVILLPVIAWGAVLRGTPSKAAPPVSTEPDRAGEMEMGSAVPGNQKAASPVSTEPGRAGEMEAGNAVPGNQENTVETGADTDWNLTLVNRWNPVPGNYEVKLVEVAGGQQVDERIYEPLMEMLEAAREGNLDQLPRVVSGYRTQEKQQRLYDEKIEEYRGQGFTEDEAAEMAEQWVAVPGYSEHQLGIAVDINGATYDVYLWLQENSYKYGFIFRYPGNRTEITGTAEEVWHYRYVGTRAAAEIHEQGICLEEYLENQKSPDET